MRPAAAQGPLRVAHLITRLEPGGAQRNTLHTVSHLDRGRFRPSLFCGAGGLLDREARESGVPVTFVEDLVGPVRPARDLRALAALTDELRRLRPQIVHTHSSKAGVLGRLAARRARVPVILHTVHGFGFTPAQSPARRALFLAAERLASRWTTHFILVSEANRRQGIELGLFHRSQTSLIRSGVALQRFREARPDRQGLERGWGIPPDAPLVGMIGCLKPQKAPLDFVEVARRIAAEHEDAHFVLAGDGTLRDRIEGAAARAGLGGRFHVLGWRDDVDRILKSLQVLVHTARWEGLPRVFLEALSAGVPVVATRVDGATDVIRDGENGYLAEPGDVATLARRTCALLGDGDLRGRIASGGLADSEQFDIDHMVRLQEQLYLRLWEEASGRGAEAAMEERLAGSRG